MNDKKYEEVGTNYRYFLKWRQASFAGYIVILYGVVNLSSTIYKELPEFVWVVPLLASPIGILLWVFDVRTRELYHAVIAAGKDIESPGGGFYTNLFNNVALPKGASSFSKFTQTAALNLLFIGFSIFLFLFGFIGFLFWVFCKTTIMKLCT